MIRLVAQDDLIVSVVSGDVDGIPLPSTLDPAIGEALASDDTAARRAAVARLRLIDGEIVDVSGPARTFHIDGFGRKHAVDGPGRTELLCAHDAEIEPDGAGGWKLVDQAVRLIAYAAEIRWRREVGGILVGAVPVATDDRSKTMIIGARVAATADPAWSTVWHGADGQTYPVDAAAMIAISDEVQAHVNSGFAVFTQVKAAIEAGTITTPAAVEAAFSA